MTNEIPKYSIEEHAMKQIGSFFPYGDTNIDKIRSENADTAIRLLESLVDKLIDSAKLKVRQEWSIQEIAQKCNDALLETAHYIINALED